MTADGAVHTSTGKRTFGVAAELTDPLSTLTGRSGFEALVSRALILTTADFPRLGLAKTDALRGVDLSQIQPPLSADEAIHGEIAFLSNLLQLLCLFVGEALVLRLLGNIWPQAPLSDIHNGKEKRA